MGNIVAKFDIDKLFAGVYEAVDIITATVVDAMRGYRCRRRLCPIR